ncbi:MAG: 50S ribosomal protein L18e [Candidatus Methanomethylicia archaeon]|jgi:large subunit ribosomal protein L18e|uniref:Large ribosomal subunit protein eL18 n=1 Tax=Thermoproteota archaeon TaxID=2056631 RepID=A0A520KEC8_9CREN|nr:50S ribosomal protein L18e [Candidatus Methanomethylicia archaeon]RZN55419.1 MAG: 50S ribosomal protein L18e [Candidatus Verstraetearchaeota archaeon]TDA38420.1 MAG: 50S ribosomal protein L18e [Candidatus Verstraetearchaeota archaeon]
MVKRTLPTNPRIRRLVRLLRKTSNKYNTKVWKAIAEALCIPSRKRIVINLSKVNRLAKEGECIVVAGKVLGFGNLSKKVDIAALSFSKTAKSKIIQSGGRALYLEELISINPKGKNVRILR